MDNGDLAETQRVQTISDPTSQPSNTSQEYPFSFEETQLNAVQENLTTNPNLESTPQTPESKKRNGIRKVIGVIREKIRPKYYKERLSIAKDQIVNDIRRVNDTERLRTDRSLLLSSEERLLEDRVAQESRIEGDGFMARFRERGTRKKMDSDLKEAQREMKSARKEAESIEIKLNNAIQQYNERAESYMLRRLPIIETRDAVSIRSAKFDEINQIIPILRGFDAIIATNLENNLNDYRVRIRAYNTASDKRDRAYNPRRYLGTRNSRNLQAAKRHAEESIVQRSANLIARDIQDDALQRRRQELDNSVNTKTQEVEPLSDLTVPISTQPTLETLNEEPNRDETLINSPISLDQIQLPSEERLQAYLSTFQLLQDLVEMGFKEEQATALVASGIKKTDLNLLRKAKEIEDNKNNKPSNS